MERQGLLYNTERDSIIISEYGRNMQEMIRHLMEIEDRQKRTEAARFIISVMAQMNPQVKESGDYVHKLWDHLMIMSGFVLESAWPFGQEELAQLKERHETTENSKAEKLPYKDRTIGSRHYGEYLESMLHHLKDIPDGEEYRMLVTLVAQQAKRSYLVWNGELSDDNIVVEQMVRISGDERLREYLIDKPIVVPPNTLPIETAPSKKKKKRK